MDRTFTPLSPSLLALSHRYTPLNSSSAHTLYSFSFPVDITFSLSSPFPSPLTLSHWHKPFSLSSAHTLHLFFPVDTIFTLSFTYSPSWWTQPSPHCRPSLHTSYPFSLTQPFSWTSSHTLHSFSFVMSLIFTSLSPFTFPPLPITHPTTHYFTFITVVSSTPLPPPRVSTSLTVDVLRTSVTPAALSCCAVVTCVCVLQWPGAEGGGAQE